MRGKLIALGLLLAGEASAQEAGAFSAERFRPSITREGFGDLQWAGVDSALSFDVGLFFGYAKTPLALYEPTSGGLVRRVPLVDDRVGANLLLSFAILDFLELGVDLPLVLTQGRPGAMSLGGVSLPFEPLTGFGLGDLRVQPKFRFLGAERFGVDLSLIAVVGVPTSPRESYLGDGFTVTPMIAFDVPLENGLRAALNVGYTIREESRVAGLVVDDELVLRVGAGYRFDARFEVPFEADLTLSSALGTGDFGAKETSPVELLLDLRYEIVELFQIFAGAGLGLTNGAGAPDARAYGGLRFFWRNSDLDDDGVKNRHDKCPKVKEDLDKFEDEDGCPDPDNDKDGVPDTSDKAPNDPEDKDGFEDEDGAPDLDNDGDGVLDKDDRCPNHKGPAERQGCADGDGDGVDDPSDKCPGEPEDKDGVEDDDGCPDLDNDKDGVVDAADRCPRDAGPVENKGCPDQDRDLDGVVDRLDNCPDFPGTKENFGCKDRQLVQITAERIQIFDKIYFAFNSHVILPKSFKLLNNLADVIRAHPEVRLLSIEGHTDDVGSDKTNKALSQKRADSVRRYLLQRNIDPARLRAIGYGEERPIDSNASEAGRAMNRRVEFNIVDSGP